jgi:hypothetical protein
MEKIIGITNNAGKGKYVFFGEQDKIDLFSAYEEANFISQVGGIDVDLLMSSHSDIGLDMKDSRIILDIANYHFVSYDVLSRNELKSVQRLRSESEHYPDLDELQLSRIRTQYCRLRIGNKRNKANPIFIERFICPTNKHVKSRSHVWLYQLFCHVPQVTSPTKKVINQSQILCVYTIGQKREDRLLNKVLKIFRSDNRGNTKKRKTYK